MTRFKPKKPVPTPPYLVSVIQKISQASTAAELSECLTDFSPPNKFENQEERTLSTWYEVLNKFDDLLETYIKQHAILPSVPRPSQDSGLSSGQNRGRAASANAASSGGRTARLSDARTSSGLIPSLESMLRPRHSDRQNVQSPKPDDVAGHRSFSEPVTPNVIFLILKATYRLVKNSSYDTRSVYGSMEHISALLADPSKGIVLISLEILNTLLQRSPKLRPTRTPLPLGLTDRLRDIAQGWGGRENGLGLVDCCSSRNEDALPIEGHSFRIEFKVSTKSKPGPKDADGSMQAQGASSTSKSPQRSSGSLTSLNDSYATRAVVGDVMSISVPDVRELPGNEKWLVTEFMARYKIPRSKAFSLLCAYRRAKAFGNGRNTRLSVTCQQLLALTTLSQLQPPPRPLADLLQKEQELIPDIIALAKADSADGLDGVPKSLSILSVRCLTAMSSERSRLSQITAAAGVGSHHGTFASLLRSEISAILGPASDTVDNVDDADATSPTLDSGERMETDSDNTHTASAMALDSDADSNREKGEKSSPVSESVQMAEALLAFVHTIALTGGSSGATSLVGSGTLGIIVPLLRDRKQAHARAVAQSIRAMQGIIEITHASSGSQSFRDHDGLALVADRIAVETLGDDFSEKPESEREKEDEELECKALEARGESREFYKDLLAKPMTVERALAHQAPSASAASRGSLPHSKWALLRSLHQLFLHALGTGGSQVRDLVPNTALPSALRQILSRPFHYGGGLFSVAAMVATAIAHSEPTTTAELVKAGIAKAVVKSVAVGLPPYGDAIRCIPNALAAICLAHKAREDIVLASPLRAYVLRLATPFYSRALQGDVPTNIGGALDELMRHVEALRPSGNEAIIQFLTQAAAFIQLDISHLRDSGAEASTNSASSSPLKKSGATAGCISRSDKPNQPGADSTPSDYVLVERMKLAVAHNAARLAGFSQGSSEHQNAIVRKGGLEQMLMLRIAPAMASAKAYARDSHPSFRASPTPANAIVSLASSLRSFSSHHDADVLKGLFSVIREDAAKVLRIAASLGNAWLPEEDSSNRFIVHLRPELPKSGKEGSGRKRSRPKNSKTIHEQDEDVTGSEMKVDSGSAVQESRARVPILASEISQARADLKTALCVLRVDVVLLGNLSRGGPGSLAGAWEAAGGSAVTALIAAVERSARWHLAVVYTGLDCQTTSDGDLCTAHVTAVTVPALKPAAPGKYLDYVGVASSRMGISSVTHSEFVSACRAVQVLPEKEEAPRQDVKGLAWAMETFVYSAQKLYMSLGRGIIFSSRRLNRDPNRYAASARSLAATIGSLLALHLKAAESLWTRTVVTMGDSKVSAAWDYIRRVVIEIQSTLFCESNRNTQGLIMRFFLSAGGAEVLQQVCRPCALLEGSQMKLPPTQGIDVDAYSTNKKKFQTFLQSNQLPMIYTSLVLGEVRRIRELKNISKSPSGDTKGISKDCDADAEMIAVDAQEKESAGLQANGNTATVAKKPLRMNLSSMQKQVSSISDIVLHFRKQVAVNRIASDSWKALSSLLLLFSNCPGLLSATPGSLPVDPDSAAGSWEPKDVQRTAQSVAVKLLLDVTREPSKLVSACRPGESLTSDVVNIILSVLKTSSELCRIPELESTDNRPDSDAERQTTDDPPTPSTPNPEHVNWLTEMGFSESRAMEALRQSHPPGAGGVESALEWLTSFPERETPNAGNGEDSSSSDEEQNESIGDATGEDRPSGTPAVESGDTEMNIGDNEETSGQNADSGTSADREADNQSAPHEGAGSSPLAEQPGDSSTVKSNPDKKTKGTEDEYLEIATESAALLRRAAGLEMKDLNCTVAEMGTLSNPERAAVLKMINSAIDFEFKQSEPEERKKGEIQRQIAKAKAVSVDEYKTSKTNLFESLIPVAKAVIKHEVRSESSLHASFVAVELLSILQKDKCLSPEIRLEFAQIITSELKTFLDAPLASGQSMNSVVGIRTSFVWAHYGGSQAREALRMSGAADLAFRTLDKMSKTWEDLKSTTTVDEEATKPIQHLSINENLPATDVAMRNMNMGNKKDLAHTTLVHPGRSQVQAMHCMDTCLLILDAFVRFHVRDHIVKHATKERTPKHANAMEVDREIEEEPRTSRLTPHLQSSRNSEVVLDEIMRATPEKEDEERMDVDGKVDDLDDLTAKLKSKAEEDRQKALKSVTSDLDKLTGFEDGQDEMPFPAKELLRCCTKLLSSLAKYEAGDIIVSLLQVICGLTAQSQLALQFMNEGGVDLLLELPHIESNRPNVSSKLLRSLVRSILRHVVEDTETLTEAMEAELRGILGQASHRGRSYTMTISNLIGISPGLANRNLKCFVRAFTNCARARTSSRGSGRGQTEPLTVRAEEDTRSINDWMVESKKRVNVVCVVKSLTRLLVSRSKSAQKSMPIIIDDNVGAAAGSTDSPDALAKSQVSLNLSLATSDDGLVVFALAQLAELVELCPVIAAEFLQAMSPSKETCGTALDYVVQDLLPLPDRVVGASGSPTAASLSRIWADQEEIAEAAKALVLALVSKNAKAHVPTVKALARAAEIEACRSVARGGALKSLSQCIIPNTKMLVLKEVLYSGLANNLAKSLEKLDMSRERNIDATTSVLKALSLIGNTATQLSVRGPDNNDDVGSGTQSQELWAAMREDARQAVRSGFMVL